MEAEILPNPVNRGIAKHRTCFTDSSIIVCSHHWVPCDLKTVVQPWKQGLIYCNLYLPEAADIPVS
jgi:hypothetical protein